LTGASGPQGPIGLTGATGATGATGQQGPIGLTGPAGANGTNGINGTNGTNGLNALIKTTTEPAGANCTNGGTKIETGLDANGNGVLDASEVNTSQTQYVCNGLNGIVGNSTIQSSFTTSIGFSSSTTWVCPTGITKIKVELWGGAGGGAGGSGSTQNNGCQLWIGIGYVGAYGGAGGAGGYNSDIIDVIPGNSYLITIGQGGGGGYPNACGYGGQGGQGGQTSFGSLLTADGGQGGNGGFSTTGTQGSAGNSGALINWNYPNSISNSTYIPSAILTPVVSRAAGGSNGARGSCCGNVGNSSPTQGGNGENGFCIIRF
jgi:hypothetical protein